jgi:hypothetical protein
MKKKEFGRIQMAREMAKNADIPYVQALFLVEVLFDSAIKKIKEGYDIIFPSIGTLRQVPGREMRSNLTGVTIPEHKRLKFTNNIPLARYVRIETRVRKIR